MSETTIKLALAGNPNSGKTSLFNALTGARQHVANYPGVTVEKKEGTARLDGEEISIIDLPGTYSLTAYSLEEVVARNYLINERPDVVVDVVDAANLERNLYLAVQLKELGVPIVYCLNMMDVAGQRGIIIDVDQLSTLLKAPVIPCVARTGKGVKDLLAAAAKLAKSKPAWTPLDISYGQDVDQALSELTKVLEGRTQNQGLMSARWLALKCLENDQEVMNTLSRDQALAATVKPIQQKLTGHLRNTLADEPENIVADYRYGYISGIMRKTVQQERRLRLDATDRVDRVLTHRLIGPLFLLGVLYAIYQFVFWASEIPVEWTENLFGWLTEVTENNMEEGLFRSLMVDGIIGGVGGVLGFVPLIMFMFFAIAVMEDSGYMARVAYIMDRILRMFGLHGNSVIALIVSGGISGGCAVPGVMAARTLKDPKARLATILVAPLMNCGAKLPVHALLVAAFFVDHQAQILFGLTILGWILALLVAKVLRVFLLKGEQAPFVMELPPYRTPTLKGILIHTWERSWEYLKRAGTLLLAVSIVMWALMTFPTPTAEVLEHQEQQIAAIEDEEAKTQMEADFGRENLAQTIAGRMGNAITVVTEPLGFGWQTNVALVGGLAAKEVIVATLGTAYSLEATDDEEQLESSLAERLRATPGWSPLTALTLMVFVLIYSPCIATLAVMKREVGSWRWLFFSMIYTTSLAYVLALIINQGGRALGLGLG